jgi:hypothetical protein
VMPRHLLDQRITPNRDFDAILRTDAPLIPLLTSRQAPSR